MRKLEIIKHLSQKRYLQIYWLVTKIISSVVLHIMQNQNILLLTVFLEKGKPAEMVSVYRCRFIRGRTTSHFSESTDIFFTKT